MILWKPVEEVLFKSNSNFRNKFWNNEKYYPKHKSIFFKEYKVGHGARKCDQHPEDQK